ncbi:MAG: CtsR family transcriptional regulator [Solirubrobacterales bacterium]
MKSLSDRIEQYIKVLIERSGVDEISIQRAELAETFQCVPSQISYVLSTRFTMAAGFLTESRRGGKGFVKIRRVTASLAPGVDRLNRVQAVKVLEELLLRGWMSREEMNLMKEMLANERLNQPAADGDTARTIWINVLLDALNKRQNQGG